MQGAEGVYFRHEDYAPFWVRGLMEVIDLLVFGAFPHQLSSCRTLCACRLLTMICKELLSVMSQR